MNTTDGVYKGRYTSVDQCVTILTVRLCCKFHSHANTRCQPFTTFGNGNSFEFIIISDTWLHFADTYFLGHGIKVHLDMPTEQKKTSH